MIDEIKDNKHSESSNDTKPIVSGSFGQNTELERLIKKWEIEADIIKGMADDVKNGKSPRKVYNHFLIQLLKCIGDAKVELKNCH